MMLVKNPAGYNQVINLISHDVGSCKLAFLLNDRFADGTDISWIWDVDFEALAAQQSRFTRILRLGCPRGRHGTPPQVRRLRPAAAHRGHP